MSANDLASLPSPSASPRRTISGKKLLSSAYSSIKSFGGSSSRSNKANGQTLSSPSSGAAGAANQPLLSPASAAAAAEKQPLLSPQSVADGASAGGAETQTPTTQHQARKAGNGGASGGANGGAMTMARDGSLGLPHYSGDDPADKPAVTPSRPKLQIPSRTKSTGKAHELSAEKEASGGHVTAGHASPDPYPNLATSVKAPTTTAAAAAAAPSTAAAVGASAPGDGEKLSTAMQTIATVLEWCIQNGMPLVQQGMHMAQEAWDRHDGPSRLRELLHWPMLTHVGMAVTLIYSLGYMRVFPLLAVPWMVIFLWLIWNFHLKRTATSVRAAARLECVLSGLIPDKESAWWLNMAMEKAWPVFANALVSNHVLPKLAPWFLNNYKPVMLASVDVKEANMGDQPPVLSNITVFRQAASDNHLEMEMDVEIASADNMYIQTAARVSGMGAITWTAFVTGLHLTGRMRVGIKFQSSMPFIERVSIMFPKPPQVSCAIRVMGGFDAASMPLVATYVDSTLQSAIKSSLCWPNRLMVVDVVKAVGFLLGLTVADTSSAVEAAVAAVTTGGLTERKVKMMKVMKDPPAATAVVEIIEADNLIAADAGGTSDPYVKGSLGPARFTTEVQFKTLSPSWGEVYSLPVIDWGAPESFTLKLRVRDYDAFTSDDELGTADVDLRKLRGGLRHNLRLQLGGVKHGSIHIAVTIKGDVGLTEEERASLLQQREAEQSKRTEKMANFVGHLDPKAGAAAVAVLDSLERMDPKAAAEKAGTMAMEARAKLLDQLQKHGLMKKSKGGDDVGAALVQVEVVEARDLVAADRGGTSDPYVKGVLERAKFTTKVIPKTLNPKWLERHMLPLAAWPENGGRCLLQLAVWDRDRFAQDDRLGTAQVDLMELRDGETHDMWLPLDDVPTGTLRLNIRVMDLAGTSGLHAALQALQGEGGEEGVSEADVEVVEEAWRGEQEERGAGLGGAGEQVKGPAAAAGAAGPSKAAAAAAAAVATGAEDGGILTESKAPAAFSTKPLQEVAASAAPGALTGAYRVKSFVKVEIIEARELIAVDGNGTSDPFVKGTVGPAPFRTKHVSKTLSPKWYAEFKVPIVDWQATRTPLILNVFDRSTFSGSYDMGHCEINLNLLRDGLRHDMWVRLDGVKSGKLRVAVTALEESVEVQSTVLDVVPGIVVEVWDVKTTAYKSKKKDRGEGGNE